MKSTYLPQSLLFLTILTLIYSRCSFEIAPDMTPLKVNKEPYMVSGMSLCKEYNGKIGCCNQYNDQQQVQSYPQIDGIFSSLGDGCDICAVNLKRFWCEYACSPNQAQFAQVQQGYFPMPSPTKPDQTVMVQKVTLTINAQTACDLYSSCSRNAFVSSVSAMGTPAGFLSFLGSNSIDAAQQYMTMKFTYSKNNSIYYGDDSPNTQTKALDVCNRTIDTDTIHQFPVFKNCTCNNCASSCTDDNGFVYQESSVFEGFNYVFVGSVWAVALAVSFTVSTLRKKNLSNLGQNEKARKQI